MKINQTTKIASLILGGLLIYPIARAAKRSTNSLFAFVTDDNGEPIYENPAGSTPITRLAKGEYVGALTGKTNGDFVEVETTIGEGSQRKPYVFWIYKKAIGIIEGQPASASYINSGVGYEKTNANKRAIVKHFA